MERVFIQRLHCAATGIQYGCIQSYLVRIRSQRILSTTTANRPQSSRRRLCCLLCRWQIRIRRSHWIAIHRQRRRLLRLLRRWSRLGSLLRPNACRVRKQRKHSRSNYLRPETLTAKVHSTPGDCAPSAEGAPAAAQVLSSIYASSHPSSLQTVCTQLHIRCAVPR